MIGVIGLGEIDKAVVAHFTKQGRGARKGDVVGNQHHTTRPGGLIGAAGSIGDDQGFTANLAQSPHRRLHGIGRTGFIIMRSPQHDRDGRAADFPESQLSGVTGDTNFGKAG